MWRRRRACGRDGGLGVPSPTLPSLSPPLPFPLSISPFLPPSLWDDRRREGPGATEGGGRRTRRGTETRRRTTRGRAVTNAVIDLPVANPKYISRLEVYKSILKTLCSRLYSPPRRRLQEHYIWYDTLTLIYSLLHFFWLYVQDNRANCYVSQP